MDKQIIRCTACSRRMSIPATAGSRVRCPSCHQVNAVSRAATVAQPAAVAQSTVAAAGRTASPNPQANLRSASTHKPGKARTIPLPAAAPCPADQPVLEGHSLLQGLDQKIPRVRASLGYRLTLMGGAALVALLPLVYLGLIVAAGMGVVWWATAGLGVFQAPVRGRGGVLLVAAYVGPLFIGGLLIVFMIKPLFFRQARSEKGRSLTRDAEPLLFAFVDKICASVCAPRPRRIDVDCQVNASASFRRGLRSFLGGDLVLTIGMPLAAGLSTRQLAGVLAHEFGHFSQGAGMRASYLIMSINRWFHRVVYGRDTMDQWLDEAAESAGHLLLILVLQLARLMVWFSRRVLWLLMMIGHACSCALLRQMEFDADLHETRLAGSTTFGRTSRELQRLGFAYGESLNRAARAYRDGRLPDDVPALTRFERQRAKPETLSAIDQRVESLTTGFFDTHPCDAERIARAEAEKAPGLYRVEAPASELFQHFEAICKGVTNDFYRDTFGSVPDAEKMVPVASLAQQQRAEDDAGRALERLLGTSTTIPWDLRLPLTLPNDKMSGREVAEALRTAKQSMQELRDAYRSAFARYDELDTRWLTCCQVASLRSAGAQLDSSHFDVPTSTSAAARQEARSCESKLKRAEQDLAPMYDAFASRVTWALRLARIPKVTSRLKNGPSRLALADRSIEAAGTLASNQHRLAKLRNDFQSLRAVGSLFEGEEPSKQLLDEFTMLLKSVCERIQELRDAVIGKPFPFDHADGVITLDKYLVPELPLNADPAGVFQAADGCLDRAYSLFFRSTAHLASITVDVETILGMEPDPEPVQKEDDAEGTRSAVPAG